MTMPAATRNALGLAVTLLLLFLLLVPTLVTCTWIGDDSICTESPFSSPPDLCRQVGETGSRVIVLRIYSSTAQAACQLQRSGDAGIHGGLSADQTSFFNVTATPGVQPITDNGWFLPGQFSVLTVTASLGEGFAAITVQDNEVLHCSIIGSVEMQADVDLHLHATRVITAQTTKLLEVEYANSLNLPGETIYSAMNEEIQQFHADFISAGTVYTRFYAAPSLAAFALTPPDVVQLVLSETYREENGNSWLCRDADTNWEALQCVKSISERSRLPLAGC